MKDELNRHKKSDALKWVLTLIAFIVVGVMLAGIILGWFEKKELPDEDKDTATTDYSNSLVVNGQESRGISLLSARAESATSGQESVTITATVKPDNTAENTGVEWAINWKNADSGWASGKSVTSYVTLSSGDTYVTSKTATLTCLQAFGEQIIVKATAKDNAGVTGTVSVDYAQKLNDISLSFGTVRCNFAGGRTGVKVELNQNGTPLGGMPSLTQSKDTTYTVADTFNVSYKISDHYHFMVRSPASMPGNYTNHLEFGVYNASTYETDSSKIENHSVVNKGLYFGVKWFVDNFDMHSLQSGRGDLSPGDIYTDVSVADLTNRFVYAGQTKDEYYYDESLDLFELTVTVTGRYSTLTKSTVFYMNGYTNASRINGMDLNKTSVVL